ncbi:MAG: hypothetical protein QM689_02895 [Oscillospiraceae bacterium]
MAEKIQSRLKKNGLFKTLFAGDKKTKLIIAVGLLAMLLILLTEFLPDKGGGADAASQTYAQPQSADAYRTQLEQSLTKILEKINGVGAVTVLVTLEGTTEYVYAEDTDKSISSDSTGSDENVKSELVLVESGGDKQALVKKVIQPKVSGVVVVCQGGSNLTVSEQVYKAVSAALGISYAKICVADC